MLLLLAKHGVLTSFNIAKRVKQSDIRKLRKELKKTCKDQTEMEEKLRQMVVLQMRKPTAIFCGNDLLAVGAMLEAERMGLNVPVDLSICGIDNLEISEAINPGLTTVSLPTQDLGRIAAQYMLSAISGEIIAAKSLLPFELVVRGSTGLPRR